MQFCQQFLHSHFRLVFQHILKVATVSKIRNVVLYDWWQNEKNLNVVIQKDTNTGIVYKNNVDKFITMNMQDIIDKSMEKLNKHLNEIYQNIFNDLQNDPNKNNLNVLNDFKESVQSKFDNFIKEPNTKNMVEKII